VPVWRVQPGAKKQRASRVKDYLNTYIFYRMTGWEADTDQLTYVLPIVGCAFRKVSWQDGMCVSRLVSALEADCADERAGLRDIAPAYRRD
jgi:hypothetical protein